MFDNLVTICTAIYKVPYVTFSLLQVKTVIKIIYG